MSINAKQIATLLLIIAVSFSAIFYFTNNAYAQSAYEQCIAGCGDGDTVCISDCRDLPGAGLSDPSTSNYEQCIDACAPCNSAQVSYCRSLPGAGSGGGTQPGGGGTQPSGGSFGLTNPLSFDSIEGLLDKIAGFLFVISIPLLVIMIIIGAFYLMTAGGNEEKIKTGKKTITWAIIGFVIILLAASIAALIQNFLEG